MNLFLIIRLSNCLMEKIDLHSVKHFFSELLILCYIVYLARKFLISKVLMLVFAANVPTLFALILLHAILSDDKVKSLARALSLNETKLYESYKFLIYLYQQLVNASIYQYNLESMN